MDRSGMDSVFGCITFIVLCTIVATWLLIVAQNADPWESSAEIRSEELLDCLLSSTVELRLMAEGELIVVEISVRAAILDMLCRAVDGVNDTGIAVELGERIEEIVTFLLDSNYPWKLEAVYGSEFTIEVASSGTELDLLGNIRVVQRHMTSPDAGTVCVRLTHAQP